MENLNQMNIDNYLRVKKIKPNHGNLNNKIF